MNESFFIYNDVIHKKKTTKYKEGTKSFEQEIVA